MNKAMVSLTLFPTAKSKYLYCSCETISLCSWTLSKSKYLVCAYSIFNQLFISSIFWTLWHFQVHLSYVPAKLNSSSTSSKTCKIMKKNLNHQKYSIRVLDDYRTKSYRLKQVCIYLFTFANSLFLSPSYSII